MIEARLFEETWRRFLFLRNKVFKRFCDEFVFEYKFYENSNDKQYEKINIARNQFVYFFKEFSAIVGS